jgi:hypothetical protein
MTNEAKGAAMTDFLGVPVEMEVSKKSDKYELKEETNDLYRAFKKEVKFRGEFLDYLYGSEYARHFMSESEMSELRARWQSDDADQVPWRDGPDGVAEIA